ncbi:MAG: hypothetical protein ACREMG_08585, partial [Gemmatimonadales bacterium]
GGPDNITVVAAHFDGDGLPEPTEEEGVGYRVYQLPDSDSQETVPSLPPMEADEAPVADRIDPAAGRGRGLLIAAAVAALLAVLISIWF